MSLDHEEQIKLLNNIIEHQAAHISEQDITTKGKLFIAYYKLS